MSAIEISNLSKSYKEIQALKNISLNVEKGELFGLLGPDGAGKTTLLRIITSLLLPDSGTAKVSGFDVDKNFRKIRNITGYMPGKFSLYQDLTVEENINFFATIFGTTLSENYENIKSIYSQIEAFKNRRAGKLSGGMKQKLALSCALVHEPEILVLDEPTTGVDAVSRKEFWEILKEMKEREITTIVSTPYMDEATKCDRVALIQKGEILKIDTPQEIMKEFPGKLFSIESENIFQLLNDLRKFHSVRSCYSFGDTVHYSDIREDFNLQEIEHFLIEKGHKNLYIKEIEANIEDCFMDLMSKKS